MFTGLAININTNQLTKKKNKKIKARTVIRTVRFTFKGNDSLTKQSDDLRKCGRAGWVRTTGRTNGCGGERRRK